MTTDTKPRFTNVEEIKKANAAAGRFWFSPDTIKAFAARVETRVYYAGDNRRLWVESTRNYDDSAREYKIAVFGVADADVSYLWAESVGILRFRTKRAAVECVEGLL
jgi:hypothetical protein